MRPFHSQKFFRDFQNSAFFWQSVPVSFGTDQHHIPFPKDKPRTHHRPQISVEALSPRNSEKEMQEKVALYFEAGATEVWLCADDGSLCFFSPEGQLKKSHLAPDFPDSA